MGELLKLLTLGAVATAAVVVAKEVIERTEKGEDCSPKAVVRGIGKKIGNFCANIGGADDEEDFDDFEDFELDDDDESVDFGTDDMESDKLDDEGFAAFEQKEAEASAPEAPAEPESPAAPETPAEPEIAAEVPVEAPAAEATPEETVDEALDSVAKSFEGKGGKSKK